MTLLVTTSLLHGIGVQAADTWSPILSASCMGHGITTRLRVAVFLANVLNETGNLSTLSECLDYSTDALLAQWPSHFTTYQAQLYGRNSAHPANERQIAELAYGGRCGNGHPGSGDGYLFRGAGCLQTTFRSNYARLGATIKWTRPLIELPEYLQTPAGASESAAIFWQQSQCSILADAGNLTAVRRTINGGTIGLQNVQTLYTKLLHLMPSV